MEPNSLFLSNLPLILGMIICWMGFEFISYFIFKIKPNYSINDSLRRIIILCGPTVLFIYLICDKHPNQQKNALE